jgi:hypothetical protein
VPTFSGSYVSEPSDFATVATEAALIAAADDPATPVISEGRLSFADLLPAELAAIQAVLNPLITRKEGVVNGFLRAGGYAVPVDVVENAVIPEYVVKLVWNDLRFRKGQLNDEEYEARNKAVIDELKLIANGTSVLVGAVDAEDEGTAETVHAIGTSERIFSRETLEDF